MKLILTGASGFVGNEVLSQALSHPGISSIIALTRKPLAEPHASNPKLQSVLLDDFTSYKTSVLEQLSGADACIWTIGAKSTSAEITKKVSVDYTLAAAEAFTKLPGSTSSTQSPFRFIFTSGILAVRDPNASVMIYPAARKAAGEAEAKLLEFAQKEKEKGNEFEAFVMRPAGVYAKEQALRHLVSGVLPSVRVDELAAALIGTARGGGAKQTLENADLKRLGRELLKS